MSMNRVFSIGGLLFVATAASMADVVYVNLPNPIRLQFGNPDGMLDLNADGSTDVVFTVRMVGYPEWDAHGPSGVANIGDRVAAGVEIGPGATYWNLTFLMSWNYINGQYIVDGPWAPGGDGYLAMWVPTAGGRLCAWVRIRHPDQNANYLLVLDYAYESTAGQPIHAGQTGPLLTPGDMNCDGAVSFDDINPFVLALSTPAGYAAQYPNCNILNGDVNGDGLVNFDDINPFVALLSGGQ